MQVTFHVPCIPVAQPRARSRVTVIKGRAISMHYTPRTHPVNAFKAAVQLAFAQASNGAGPHDGPVKLVATFTMPRPQSMRWKTRPMPQTWHAKKPDLDNLEKALMDALTGLAWVDDSQVADKHTFKSVAGGIDSPGVDVTIQSVDEGGQP